MTLEIAGQQLESICSMHGMNADFFTCFSDHESGPSGVVSEDYTNQSAWSHSSCPARLGSGLGMGDGEQMHGGTSNLGTTDGRGDTRERVDHSMYLAFSISYPDC